jgi:hypothetical protein
VSFDCKLHMDILRKGTVLNSRSFCYKQEANGINVCDSHILITFD